MPRRGRDNVVAALDDLTKALEDNSQDSRVLVRRVRRMRDARARGMSWQDIVGSEPDPGAIALVGRVLGRMSETSGVLRRALVLALRAEGDSIPAIARRFGVTHQRVSNLLRGPQEVAPRRASTTRAERNGSARPAAKRARPTRSAPARPRSTPSRPPRRAR